MAILAVSSSLISPINITSGSCLNICFNPLAKVNPTLSLTFVCVIPSMVNSTGSSMVLIFIPSLSIEFNNAYRKQIIEAGMKITGTSPDGRLVEIVEVENHPWFVAAQFHPELKSRPNNPHPLFKAFIKATLKGEE